MKQPEGLPNGLYFNLPKKAYHDDCALSHSGMVQILKSERDYWENSPLNPNRSFTATDAMVFGDRCHELLLEPEKFFERYTVTGSKTFKKGTTLINSGDWQKIKESVDEIKSIPEAYSYFKNGYAEVSIIFSCPFTGIRLRARIDYLRTFGGVDYKRIKTILQEEMGFEVAKYGYDIQEYVYRLAIRTAKEQIASGKMKVYGEHSPEWIDKFISTPSSEFRFFFQRSTRPFVFQIYSMDSEILDNAAVATEMAIRKYLKAIEAHGTEKWPSGFAGKTKQFEIYHMPRRILDRGGLND